MLPIQTIQQVFDGILRSKSGPGFCTNFYPAPQKLEAWISHSALAVQQGQETTFFFRRDHDFWHLSYCAPSIQALQRDLCALEELKTERVVADVLGIPEALDALLPVMDGAGMRRYKRLVRMVRPTREITASAGDGVLLATRHDAGAIMVLLETAFDRYAMQLPSPEEIEAAVESSEILLLKRSDALAGLLFFETHGVTSTLRFWAVAQEFHGTCVGSSLIWHYLATQGGVRRFVLWADADDRVLIEKYRHYHYAEDGVVDYVLTNDLITG